MCSWSHPPLLFLFCFFYLCSNFSAAIDTLSFGESLIGSQTLVSKGGNFELGFFSPGSSHNYYIGIRYKKISQQTVIWLMNRDTPVSDPSSSKLKIAEDGNLVLLNQSKLPIWSSNSTQARDNSMIVVLLDTGNLVLTDRNNSAIIWESFDHPTDTLVPGGWVGLNKITGAYQSLTSWRSSKDPSTGMFMDRIDPYGSSQYVFLWNGTRIYHYVAGWNGRSFSSIPEMGIVDGRYTYFYTDNDQVQMYSFEVNDPSIISRLVMSPNGQLTQFDWSPASQQWVLHWASPTSQCDVYSVCGSFGLCDMSSSQYCRCLPGFEPASPRDWFAQSWSGGCVRKTSLECGNMPSDGFLAMQNLKLPNSSESLINVASIEECELACLSNCTCTVYAYQDGCFIWNGDLRNFQLLSNGDAGASTLYLRLAAADLPANRNMLVKARAAIIVAVSVIFVAIFCFCFVFAWIRRGRTVQNDGSLLVFSYAFLMSCTKNFSEKLGKGSFGSVYKGTLPDSTAIAVKRLEGVAQGEKQFRTEVRTLGSIQHVNLVRLQGFCVRRNERLLVYDHMPNGSLDSLLSGDSPRVLDWSTRFGIIVGIARGLAYLHEKCRECIIHCDIKPENILLDANFCPKVADFGLAKLIGRDFSQVLTTARGTVGYLAPEWILGLPITPKADVYSYGMMLLELISGRRNRELAEGRNVGYFPLWAAIKVGEGEFLALLDERLEGNAPLEELSRACKIACWCIQDSEALRPTMGQVVQVLEGLLRVGIAPIPRYLQQFSILEESCTF